MFALISVSNKAGIAVLGNGLINLGYQLIGSGKTAAYLRESQIPVIDVEDLTNLPEVLGGRVKTLHPAIHAGILARDTEDDLLELTMFGWSLIDLVVVNLYPFQEVNQLANISETIKLEYIDIGGVALLRAAAKNFTRVGVVCDPDDYEDVLEHLKNNEFDLNFRKELAAKAFRQTAEYDLCIADYFCNPKRNTIHGYESQALRYGENPHQKAKYYSYVSGNQPFNGKVIHGKELSYNNLLDIDAAWNTVISFEEPSISIVKHSSPCGVASDQLLSRAYQNALASDPISAFGGIVAANKVIDKDTADLITHLFTECVAAPGFSEDALDILTKKKNIRLLEIPIQQQRAVENEFRSIRGGFLIQDHDNGDPEGEQGWKVVSKRPPSEQELFSLRFGWKVVQHLKSNAVVFCQNTATVGIGSGQPNRIDCVRIAAQRAGDMANGAVMASDAFFPFADSIEQARQFGIKAIIQPGGAIRDEEVIRSADQCDMAMVFTGTRHFRH